MGLEILRGENIIENLAELPALRDVKFTRLTLKEKVHLAFGLITMR